MNAAISFSKRDLRMENIRDTARRVREANRRTFGRVAHALVDIEEAIARPVVLDAGDLELQLDED